MNRILASTCLLICLSLQSLAADDQVYNSLILVEGGRYFMGSPEEEKHRNSSEVLHEVSLTRDFYISKYEVTQAEWRKIMGTSPSDKRYHIGDNCSVNMVSWYDAVEYCNRYSVLEGLIPVYSIDQNNADPNNTDRFDTVKWLVTCDFTANGYRLPTEAEWEYAARGGALSEGYVYSGTDTFTGREQSVNELGIVDMSGGMQEWCWDWFDYYYYTNSTDVVTDPRGPESASKRCVRGGNSSIRPEQFGRSANRTSHPPHRRLPDIGFRVVRNVE
jgi:formylglycine-generating enzyme required for sulfatase activity